MTWQAVARKDFRDAIRSWWLWGLSAVLFMVLGGISLLWGWLSGEAEGGLTSDHLFGIFGDFGALGQFSFTGFLGFVLALIALVTAYGSIIDERESGTLKLLLSLPHSRADVIVGKMVGRSAVVTVPLLGAFLVVIVGFALTGVEIVFGNLLPHIALTVLVTIAFVSLAVGISAWAMSGRQATVATFAIYFFLSMLWSVFAEGLPSLYDWIAERAPLISPMATETSLQIELFITYLNPLRAYETLAAGLYSDSTLGARLVKVGIFEQQAYVEALGESLPFYFQDWFIVLILLAWIAVPLLIGYVFFAEDDL